MTERVRGVIRSARVGRERRDLGLAVFVKEGTIRARENWIVTMPRVETLEIVKGLVSF